MPGGSCVALQGLLGLEKCRVVAGLVRFLGMPPKASKRRGLPAASASDAFAQLAKGGPLKLKSRPSFPQLPSAALSAASYDEGEGAAAKSAAANGPRQATPAAGSPRGKGEKTAKPSTASKMPAAARRSGSAALGEGRARSVSASGVARAMPGTPASPTTKTQSRGSAAKKSSSTVDISPKALKAALAAVQALYSSGTVSGEVLALALGHWLAAVQGCESAAGTAAAGHFSIAGGGEGAVSKACLGDAPLRMVLQLAQAVAGAEFDLHGRDGVAVEADTARAQAGPAAKRARNTSASSASSTPPSQRRVRFCTFDLSVPDATARDVGTAHYILPYTEPAAPSTAEELFTIGGKLVQPPVAEAQGATLPPGATAPAVTPTDSGQSVPGVTGACGVPKQHPLKRPMSKRPPRWTSSVPSGALAALPVPPGVAAAYAESTLVHCPSVPGGPTRRAAAGAVPATPTSFMLPPPVASTCPIVLRHPQERLAVALHGVMECAAPLRSGLEGRGRSAATQACHAVVRAVHDTLAAWGLEPPVSVGSAERAAPRRSAKRPRAQAAQSGPLHRRLAASTFKSAAQTLAREISTLFVPRHATVSSGPWQVTDVAPAPLLLPFQQRYTEVISSLFRHTLRRAFNGQVWEDESPFMQLHMALLREEGGVDGDEEEAGGSGDEEFVPDGNAAGADAASTTGLPDSTHAAADSSAATSDAEAQVVDLEEASPEAMAAMAQVEAAWLASVAPDEPGASAEDEGKSVASATSAMSAASRAKVPGAGSGVGVGGGATEDGSYLSIADGEALKYNSDDLAALVYRALLQLHWGRSVVLRMIHPHTLLPSTGEGEGGSAPPPGGSGGSASALTLQQCVDRAPVQDLATAYEFCVGHMFLQELLTAPSVIAAVEGGGDAWTTLQRLGAHVIAWGLVEEGHAGAFADLLALGRQLSAEEETVREVLACVAPTLTRHHRALARARANSASRRRKGSARGGKSSARASMAASNWSLAAMPSASDSPGQGVAASLLRPAEGTLDAASNTWRFGRYTGLSVTAAQLHAEELFLSAPHRFQYPKLAWAKPWLGMSLEELAQLTGQCEEEEEEEEGGDTVHLLGLSGLGQMMQSGAVPPPGHGSKVPGSPPRVGGASQGKGAQASAAVPPSPVAFPFSG